MDNVFFFKSSIGFSKLISPEDWPDKCNTYFIFLSIFSKTYLDKSNLIKSTSLAPFKLPVDKLSIPKTE